jgi:DNA modification methylase
MPANSVDFILTDPPYLVNYRDRTGRTIQNDADDTWLKPAMAEAYRVLKQDRVAIMFYGWTKIDAFFDAWRSAGFQPVGHIVFRKSYSSKSRFLRYQHEQAFLLAKGRPPLPKQPLGDVMEMPYSGNKLHPTQKPVAVLAPLIRSFTLLRSRVAHTPQVHRHRNGRCVLPARQRSPNQNPPEGRSKAIFCFGHSHASVMLSACPPRLKASYCSES